MGRDIRGKAVLEIGVGITNSACYEMASRGAEVCYAYEPRVWLDKRLDQDILRKNPAYEKTRGRVVRIKTLDEIGPLGVDAVFSNHVLEYINSRDLMVLFRTIRRIIGKNGWMMHNVNYSDHFFKYPFHFYKYSERFWKAIDPGLSRLRIKDHMDILSGAGFRPVILRRDINMEAFDIFRRRNRIAPAFSSYGAVDLATVSGIIFSEGVS
ncbi:MAG: class I SAM-dependent methyltransferase [Candidatus Omnitrophica bacterium]|nr:class I SAM-dependent methyltransferase [Candidatus Omnitrophota bacterium]